MGPKPTASRPLAPQNRSPRCPDWSGTVFGPGRPSLWPLFPRVLVSTNEQSCTCWIFNFDQRSSQLRDERHAIREGPGEGQKSRLVVPRAPNGLTEDCLTSTSSSDRSKLEASEQSKYIETNGGHYLFIMLRIIIQVQVKIFLWKKSKITEIPGFVSSRMGESHFRYSIEICFALFFFLVGGTVNSWTDSSLISLLQSYRCGYCVVFDWEHKDFRLCSQPLLIKLCSRPLSRGWKMGHLSLSRESWLGENTNVLSGRSTWLPPEEEESFKSEVKSNIRSTNGLLLTDSSTRCCFFPPKRKLKKQSNKKKCRLRIQHPQAITEQPDQKK